MQNPKKNKDRQTEGEMMVILFFNKQLLKLSAHSTKIFLSVLLDRLKWTDDHCVKVEGRKLAFSSNNLTTNPFKKAILHVFLYNLILTCMDL